MVSTSIVRARIDEKLKNEATKVLSEFGLSVSDVVRMALTRVVKTGAAPLN
jgi:DNA-damage-inducible protein J